MISGFVIGLACCVALVALVVSAAAHRTAKQAEFTADRLARRNEQRKEA